MIVASLSMWSPTDVFIIKHFVHMRGPSPGISTPQIQHFLSFTVYLQYWYTVQARLPRSELIISKTISSRNKNMKKSVSYPNTRHQNSPYFLSIKAFDCSFWQNYYKTTQYTSFLCRYLSYCCYTCVSQLLQKNLDRTMKSMSFSAEDSAVEKTPTGENSTENLQNSPSLEATPSTGTTSLIDLFPKLQSTVYFNFPSKLLWEDRCRRTFFRSAYH